MATSTTTAPTAFRLLTLGDILKQARTSKAMAGFAQYDDAYFAKFDRLAVMKKAHRLGAEIYAAGEQVVASAPEWNQDANYGAGALCVSCLTARGWAFSAPIEHFIAVFPVDGVNGSLKDTQVQQAIRNIIRATGRVGITLSSTFEAVAGPTLETMKTWGLLKKSGKKLVLTPAGLEYAEEKGLVGPQ